MRKNNPMDFVPPDSHLTFVKQTVVGWRKRSTGERVVSRAFYLCKCGNIKELPIGEVKRGKCKSCGVCSFAKDRQRASVTKHGIWNSPIYNVWMDIKNRCYKPRHKAYAYYGGRGVRVCDEWFKDVKVFEKWCLENGWERGLHVDKDIIPRKLGIPAILYSPEMCSIVTNKENQNNRSDNVYVTIDGKTQSVTMWCEEEGIKKDSVYRRVENGMSPTESILELINIKKTK